MHDVVVIGGGQAGLATGYHLGRAGLDFVIADAGSRVGDGWRGYWDSLRLFSPARYNALPGMPFPGDPDHCPGKDAVADYLAAYAERFELPIRSGVRVDRVCRRDQQFEIESDRLRLRARCVVVATGSHASPVVPAFASELDDSILQLTARQYRNPAQLPPGEVLVAGAGNSGVQIATELAAAERATWLAGRDLGHLPRRILHRDLFWWLDRLAVMRRDVDSPIGRLIVARAGAGGFPVVGITRREILASGVRRAPPVVGVDRGRPRLDDGRVIDARAVVWCCGLRPLLTFVDGLTSDERGVPRHTRGQSDDLDGLYFAGLRFQRRIGSDLMVGVGLDAEEITAAIATRLNRGANRRAT